MKNFSTKRFIAYLLFIVMVVAALPAQLFDLSFEINAAEGDTIYVLAGGDFQAGDNGQADHYYSRINMGNILDKIKENYSTMNGFIFVGDYDGDSHNDSNAATGVAAMMEEVSNRFDTLNHNNSYLIEGNHETGAVSGIDATGGYDCDGYAVYLINETDFCERQDGKSAQIQTVANNLKTWLNNKIGEGYDAPIFVATHTPLGYTTRTYTNGDSLYGKYVFDVLNDAAANGLNIIFMHGHDHAYGADNYLGGEAIYLPVGDKINICVPGDKTQWTEETLNFTYMNAGYVGYYNENYYNVTSYEAEKLTMTVFAITGNQVTVERWSKDGLYNLKSAGREGFYANGGTCAGIGLSYNTTVYASPQTIALVENDADEMGTIGEWVGVSATVTDDVTTSNKGWVELIAPVPGTEAVPGSTTYKYVLDTDGVNTNTKYLIVNTSSNGDAYVLTNNNGNVGRTPVTISNGEIIVEDETNINWIFSGSTSGTIVNQARRLYANNGSLALQTSGSNMTISNEGSGEYLLYRTDNSNRRYYVHHNNGWTATRVNSFSSTTYSVYLFAFNSNITSEGTPAVPGTNGTYGKIVGDLSYNATVGMTADEAMALVMAGIDGYYYDAMSTPGTNVTGTKVDDSVLTWEWVDTFDGNTAGDYEVAIKYGDFLLGTAEVVVPATTTYYIAEGNELYLVEMNTSEANAMAAVKAGITVSSATDASGSNKTAISDDDVTWNWVDTYNGADSGPYTVEILKDGTSLGTVGVKVNIKYETGIEGNWTYIGETEATGGSYTYTLDTDGIDYGEENKYIIVDDNEAIVLNANSSSNGTAHSITISGNTATLNTRDYEYHMIRTTYNGTRYELITKGTGSQYLYQESNGVRYGTRSSVKFQVNHHGNGVYDIHDIDGTNWYIIYNGGWTVTETTSARVRLYKYTGTTGGTPAGSIYALIEGNTVYTVDQGSSATKALAAVKAGITGYTATAEDGTGKTEIADSDLTWKWKNTYNGNSTGSYWVEISYQGKVLGTVEVQVIPAVVDDYPDYPNEGAVKVNKTAIYTDEQFRKTGVAQVELSVSGVPSKKGVDVILMLDTSSSMTSHTVTGTSKTRAQVLEESLANLIKQFKTPGDDGQLLDIQIAIADFNGFYGDNHNTSGTPYDRDADDMMSDDISYNANSEAQIYTGDHTLGSGAFISVDDLAASYTLNYTSGTNYDYAMDAIYQLATAKKLANGNEDRDLYVIFMSDGAAMQWNYYHSQGASSLWNNWITGAWDEDDLTTANLNCDTHKYYYNLTDTNGDGMLNEHWMANAIKGDPTQLYKVIRKTNTLGTAVPNEENMYMVSGLGATMFSISFDAQADTNVTEESMDKSIATLASEQTGTTQYYYKVTSAEELDEAFDVIGTEIAYAASNARFVDQMGDAFDIQLTNYVERWVTGADGQPEKITLDNINPTITVKTYDIWTRQDYLTGQCTIDQIGVRKGTSTVLETVSFTDDGNGTVTGAYSDQINNSGTNILADGTQTGYYKNVIYAKTFVYNNNKDGTYAYLDTDGDGVEDYALAPETFYWKVGTVTTSELAISYYVYLTDTMEGERASGSYATNNFAILYYDNYLGNECEIHTVSPMLAWKEANVSYAFYLVDQSGAVIVNRENGMTGTFANKVAVTRPVVYDTCKLNTETKLAAIEIAKTDGILPEGYKIFDDAASYAVVVLSDQEDKKIGWEINKATVATTYVTGYSTTEPYSNAQTMHEPGHDYTHTTVWFAVVWTPSTIPDQVVVDYGLPVDISVLENDLFGAGAKLYGIADDVNKPNMADGTNYTTNHIAAFVSSLNKGVLSYGSAMINGDDIRYTPVDMMMDGYDKFAYEVQYVINNETQYYYGDVTVIPATIIYYEESFVTFNDANPNDGKYGVWVDEGTAVAGVQEEDRPGKDSLGTIDHDNVYGYDAINNSSTKYSLGSAKKVSVNTTVGNTISNSPTAEFTFTGTGFDIISMTNSDSGVIFIEVFDENGESVASKFVDNYYGYAYGEYTDTEGNKQTGWFVPGTDGTATGTASNAGAPTSIYQVPVMKISELTYGEYRVTIRVSYASMFDHDSTEGYSFWLDSIRVYDPANDGKTDSDNVIENAYSADNESNPHYLQIKDAILAASDVNADKLSGIVFIDGKTSTESVADYTNPGPNNEAYLAPGQSISFKLTSTATPLAVHLGAKLAYGSTVDVQFTYTSSSGKSDSKIRTFNTTTDMYYPITDYLGLVRENQESTTGVAWESGTITLTNVSSGDAIVSLTNIKATFKIAATSNGSAINQGAAVPAAESVFSFLSTTASATPESAIAEHTVEDVSISFLVDSEVIDAACAVMTDLYAPKPEIFVPEAMEYTVLPGLFGYNTVRVITSKDVASLTVNGVEAQNLNNSLIMRSMLKLIDGIFGTKLSADDYSVWTVTTKRAASYDIVAYNAEGLSSDPAVAQSTVNSGYDRSEIYAIMAELAKKNFAPERFESYVNERFDGVSEVITETSDDVDYVVIDGEIVDRYITEKKVDLETGEETSVRVWVTETDDEEKEEISVNVYDEKGVSSESKQLENKNGKKSESKKDADNEKNNSSNKNWFGGNKFNSGKGKKERI